MFMGDQELEKERMAADMELKRKMEELKNQVD
jgi:hypothetical protein